MTSKQFNQHDEYKGHYYEGVVTIAENLVPHGDPQFLAPGPSEEADAPNDISDAPNI